ncbi:DJ-1/PfpI family protein [Paenibacillus chitinolyticus]|uniref:DJ-1/PfpI family protein n=1 Tax=Paenibacillus chitinolyticus TaxID=79263 RepID=UPI0036735199
MKIQIVLFDGFGELVSLAPFEVLKRAIDEGAPFTVDLISSEPKLEITASFGVTVKLNDFLRMDNRPDLLIVPGGGWNHKAEHGARKQAELGTLPAMIREMHNEGTIVAGVCTGGMLLAASGILDGRKATMHYLAQERFASAQIAAAVEYRMEYERRGVVWS